MEILLVLAGVLLGVVGTVVFQVVRAWYLDWRRTRAWAILGKRWVEVSRVVPTGSHAGRFANRNRSAEQKLEDLQRRVDNLFNGTPVTIEDTMEILESSDNRLPEHELEEHKNRLAQKAEGAFVPTSYEVGEDIVDVVQPDSSTK